jgi:hypothetical protein
MSPANSIEMAIWVAVGGRGTLIGPIIGAFLVNGAKTLFTAYFAEYWLFLLGAMFVLVTLYLPDGVVGLATPARSRKQERSAAERTGAVAARATQRDDWEGRRQRRCHRLGRVEPGVIDTTHGRSSTRGHDRQLRRLSRAEQAVAVDRRGELRCVSARTAPARRR